MINIDLHVHSYASPDSCNTPAQILARMDRLGLDMVAITDHNAIKGALEARSLAPERVIVGEEIKTTHGELIAYFVQDLIPPHLSPQETIACVRDQGGIVAVSHPLDVIRSEAMGRQRVLEILDRVDALEVFNARCLLPRYNRQADALARAHHLPGTAGSDAHSLYELGFAYLEMEPFAGPDAFLVNLAHARIVGRLSPAFVHLFSKFARWKKRFSFRKE